MVDRAHRWMLRGFWKPAGCFWFIPLKQTDSYPQPPPLFKQFFLFFCSFFCVLCVSTKGMISTHFNFISFKFLFQCGLTAWKEQLIKLFTFNYNHAFRAESDEAVFFCPAVRLSGYTVCFMVCSQRGQRQALKQVLFIIVRIIIFTVFIFG